MSTRTSSTPDRHNILFSAVMCTRCRQHPALNTFGCSLRTKAITPLLVPVITSALSHPTAKQFVHGTSRDASCASSILKMFSPVADSSQIGIDSSSELTTPVSTFTDLMTIGYCLLLSSLLPSVDSVKAEVQAGSSSSAAALRRDASEPREVTERRLTDEAERSTDPLSILQRY